MASTNPISMPRGRQALGLLGWLALCYGAAALGGLFTASSVQDWYPSLARPAWTPPSWLFGPVWTVLYGLMAVAAWLVWRGRGWGGARGPLGLFLLQLVLNVLWSLVFFGLRLPGAAFAEIVLLWLAILVTMIAFWRIRGLAGGLLLPYLLWVSFAAALNFALWRMNLGS